MGDKGTPVSLRESLSEIADPRNLDACVMEVFELMLGANCRREDGDLEPEADRVTAVVGLGGILSGACVFRSGGEAARHVAALMTGMEFAAVDDTVKDGIGELCNMLAGSWKGKVPELAARCGLSVPAVITGSNYELHVQAPEFRLRHVYAFDGVRFEVTILCDGIQ
ncbi:MAG TPA: chemotaxis protein CheX [Terracidiphilus sp.]|jgi:chemotaxis protein CheX|nr:chemotaxis protein CheX [Terracidiphilus sp.]